MSAAKSLIGFFGVAPWVEKPAVHQVAGVRLGGFGVCPTGGSQLDSTVG